MKFGKKYAQLQGTYLLSHMSRHPSGGLEEHVNLSMSSQEEDREVRRSSKVLSDYSFKGKSAALFSRSARAMMAVLMILAY